MRTAIMRTAIIGTAVMLVVLATVSGPASAQSSRDAPAQNAVVCPPDVKGEPPTVGSGDSKPLSDKLAQSKGVICPPSGLDRDMEVRPPAAGELKVVPPPGSPGGNQDVQPK
jgi:hypothetical protein